MTQWNDLRDTIEDAVPVYRVMSLSVRPPRVVTLFQADEQWMADSCRILENYSRVWGGAENILIPCTSDGAMLHAFDRVLRLFDPDYVLAYRRTLMHAKLSTPNTFADWLEGQVRQRCHDLQTSPEEAREFFEKGASLGQYIDKWQPRGDTDRLIRDCCAPFHYDGRRCWQHTQADGGPSHLLPDAVGFARHVGEERALPRVPDCDPRIQLMLAARCGGLAPSHERALQERNVPAAEVELSVEDALSLSWDRTSHLLSSDDGLWNKTLLAKTILGCHHRIAVDAHFAGEQTIVFVVGDKPEDFCAAVAVDRIAGHARWIPPSMLCDESPLGEQFRSAVERDLRFYCTGPGRVHKVIVTSLSLGLSEVEKLCMSWTPNVRGNVFATGLSPRRFADVPIEPVRTIYDDGAVNIIQNGAFVRGELSGPVDTPFPTSIRVPSDCQPAWIVDVRIKGWRPPRRAALAQAVSAAPGTAEGQVRCSRDGISYISRWQGLVIGNDIGATLARPSFRTPTARDFFMALLARQDLSAELSDKGRFTAGALALWGGLDSLAEDLMHAGRRRLLDAFQEPEDAGSDAPARGRGWWVSSASRRYLSFVDATVLTGLEQEDVRALLDRYVRRGILTRGFVLHCPRCSHQAWYAVEEVGMTFKCKRCRASQPIVGETWKDAPEPRWYYELAEIVYQAFRHDGDVPILALHALKRNARDFDFVPEMQIAESGGQVREIDLWVIQDGELVIGEAKKCDRLDNTRRKEERALGKLRGVAQAITADRIVFATRAREWRRETCELIETKLRDCAFTHQFLANLGRAPTD